MNRIKNLFNDGFFRSVMTLTSGSIFAQALTILVAPLLTRIYSPKELGVYTLILTAESLFGSIICGRYDVAIVTEPDKKRIYPIIKLSFFITIIFSLIASIGYGSYYFLLQDEYRNYSYAIIFIFAMLLVNGLMRTLEAYNNRYKEYKVMTSVYVLKTLAQNFGSVVLGVLKFGVFGLLISHTVGMLAGLKKQSITMKSHLKEILSSSKAEMNVVMKSHYRLPLYSAPAAFANRFSYASIALFIESLFGLSVLGLYSISYKVLGLPLTVMSNNVAKVFFQEASREYDETGKFAKSFTKTSIILLLIAIPMVLALYYLAPIAFEIVFGSGWKEAGVYVQILAPMFGVRFVVNTVAYGLQVVKKQQLELGLQLMFIISSVACLVISKLLDFNVHQYLMSITIVFSLVYVIYFISIMKFAYGKR
ncbi:lipopolysaccharide biosynthesis protein [Ornithinibacillus salinisoli]|uniref:Lipopolysaccharide biosynthesis protein n=1 Tax=Ornithinibacillus salinisoli TaxID=1848459 RepID=A0ABW4W2N6_9BACI